MSIETILAQLGNRQDPATGAISMPIHMSTTYEHPELGRSTGFDYTRTKNPTRTVLEQGLAVLENGTHAVATSSGMSAIQLVFGLYPVGSHFLVTRDVYGGSYRYFNALEENSQATFSYFDSYDDLGEQLNDSVTGIFLETPTNPLMKEISIAKVSEMAKPHGVHVIVDNTFLTPLRQRPLDEGATISLHSGTKYLTGHNDVLAGVVVTNDEAVGEKLAWLSNTTGPTLSPFDSWLFLRSLKTLPVRFDRQESSAKLIAEALKEIPEVTEVFYPGRGAMISLKVQDETKIAGILSALQVFTYAESLGGAESLITHPVTQTHADIPVEIRESYGLTNSLLRLSIGLEDPTDLIDDLKAALK
ncbi:PLP-dependent transferase [Flaviflexus massiliensis]|uniref:PLP-dependent transferase n=1 Tax=Flaviflexus massiliensis TaxID=1522309 RepID=UPI0006D56AC3|nr:PLP-dependent transferase [Flaviflexus massiliensis]